MGPVSDGDGERIGGIGRCGDCLEAELQANHFGDLALFAAAIARDGLLDDGGSVFGDFEPGIGEAEERGGAGFAESHGCPDVLADEPGLDGAGGGGQLDGDRTDTIADLDKAREPGIGGPGADDTVANMQAAAGFDFDEAEAGDAEAGIDAQDAHGGMVRRGRGEHPAKGGAGQATRRLRRGGGIAYDC